MKAEFDKEMDLLLREAARRGRPASDAPGSPAAGATASAHLDADEQSAYAENALPAMARAHYTAHLADCDDCRRGVTRLTLAAGMPAQLEPRESATGQPRTERVAWRERLGALLAPRAWRYAVPALALLLVGAVSLILLTRRTVREGAGETSIAQQRNTSNAQRPQAAAQPETHHAPQNGNSAAATGASPDGRIVTGAPDSNAPEAKEEIAANNPRADVAQPLAGAGAGDAATVAPPPPAPSSGAVERPMLEIPLQATPTPAPLEETLTITTDDAKTRSGEPIAELAKRERRQGGFEDRRDVNRNDRISGPRRSEQARNARSANADEAQGRAVNRDGELAAQATPAPVSPAAAAKSTRQPEANRSRDGNRPAEDSDRAETTREVSAAATRTVAGRKFRRQGNAWVDVNYNAGQSYTVVRRNSEQFRALVADEPELRRIAGALGGEVTVVWKGRAYRIR
jgi:hypothetical protein